MIYVVDFMIVNHYVWVRSCLDSDTTSQGFGTLEFMETLQVR